MKYFIPIAISIILFSCNIFYGDKKIVQYNDYEKYLIPQGNTNNLSKIDKEIKFWKDRLQKNPDDLISKSKIAGLLTKRFAYSGNINEVLSADSLYKLVNCINKINSSGAYRTLAANAITRHQFLQAKAYIDSALKLGDDKYLTILLQFDAAMELGNYNLARQSLKQLPNKNSFEYFIRESKYKDHVEGDLDKAIVLMEKALKKIKDSNNEALYCWTKSNLGDLYSHANRFKLAYQSYLDVLAIDSAYYHCLKGIAWLAFSHDRNTVDAKKILLYLKAAHPVPDYDLLLAEIAQYENDTISSKKYLGSYSNATSNLSYGDMYNKYNFNLAADEFQNYDEALRLAENEIKNRPTPESYHQLSWVYYKKGNIKKAVEIAKNHVQNRCFEPEVLYRLAVICKANGETRQAEELFKKAKESAFELGPVTTKIINDLIKNI